MSPPRSSSPERLQQLERAKILEQRGEHDAATNLYVRAGSIDDAARILTSQRRFLEAAHLIMSHLRVRPDQAGSLEGTARRMAMRAAICFANGGDTQAGVEMLLALGDVHRALDVLEKSGDHVGAARLRASNQKKGGGTMAMSRESTARLMAARRAPTGAASPNGAQALVRARALEQGGKLDLALAAYVELGEPGHAGRVAHKLGRSHEAASFFADAATTRPRLNYEAAVCFADSGDTEKALEHAVRVPRDDPRYGRACVAAIRLANEKGEVDFQLDHFLTSFLKGKIENKAELTALYVLGTLYEKSDFLDSAQEAFERVEARAPGFRDAAERLALLRKHGRRVPKISEKIRKEDAAFHNSTKAAPKQAAPPSGTTNDEFPDLPDLPPLDADSSPNFPAAAVSTSGATQALPALDQLPPVPPASQVSPPSSVGSADAHGLGAAPTAPPPAPSAQPVSSSTGPELVVPPQLDALAPGTSINERYEIIAKVGQGGMAAVYKAKDLELEEVIAIKLFMQSKEDSTLLSRFKQELSLSRQLAHPNIVRLYDLGTFAGCKFITMEVLEGKDLGAITEKGRLSLKAGLHYMIQACAGLGMAHRKNIVHRDIKPENFFVTNRRQLKVMDFGIAKKRSAPGLTVAGFIAGTPAYMSPEQINNFAQVTHLTDIYALGVVAYEVFTGSVPFHHEELMPLLMLHMNEQPQPPTDYVPSLPPALSKLILKCLEKDPANRVQSCEELASQLRKIGQSLTL